MRRRGGDVRDREIPAHADWPRARLILVGIDGDSGSGSGSGEATVEAATTGSAIQAIFESHLSKENDLLVPALVADPRVSLGELLDGMHELVGKGPRRNNVGELGHAPEVRGRRV